MVNKSDSDQDKNPQDITQDVRDSNIFKDFIEKTKDITRITHNKFNPFEKASDDNSNRSLTRAKLKKSKDPRYYKEAAMPSHNYQLSEHMWRPEVTANDYLFYFQPGVQHRTIRKLRSGKLRIESTLDLHQKNKEQAADLFANFIYDSYQKELRCVCVIHGKGNRSASDYPILKNLVNHWLYEIPEVLGFCSCPENFGGTGAVLVLLKR